MLQMMCTMYQKCKLIHADLSEYNMLWHEDKVWFIDVSQSVEPMHPHALEFLYRDCTNVVEFFTKCQVPDVLPAHNLFNKVSQLDITPSTEQGFLSQVKTLFETLTLTLWIQVFSLQLSKFSHKWFLNSLSRFKLMRNMNFPLEGERMKSHTTLITFLTRQALSWNDWF